MYSKEVAARNMTNRQESKHLCIASYIYIHHKSICPNEYVGWTGLIGLGHAQLVLGMTTVKMMVTVLLHHIDLLVSIFSCAKVYIYIYA